MLAYHNDPKLKKKVLEQLQESNLNLPVEQFENNLGIPMVLAHLQDAIFERLPNDLAKAWPIRFMSSINVGANLSTIWRDFALWMLVNPIDGVIQYTTPGTEAYEVILRVAKLYQDRHTQQQMIDAYYAAYDAYDASYAASYAAAGFSAAAAAAYAASAESDYYFASAVVAVCAASASAAVAVCAAYDASAVCDAAYIKMSNKLIELLEKQEVKHVSLP